MVRFFFGPHNSCTYSCISNMEPNGSARFVLRRFRIHHKLQRKTSRFRTRKWKKPLGPYIVLAVQDFIVQFGISFSTVGPQKDLSWPSAVIGRANLTVETVREICVRIIRKKLQYNILRKVIPTHRDEDVHMAARKVMVRYCLCTVCSRNARDG